MAAGKSQKAKQPAVSLPSAPNLRSPAPAIPVQPAPPAANWKKHKKKKGKGKEPQNAAFQDGDPGDDVPSLEDSMMQLPPISGLSPRLESVHITTTGYVATSATALGRPGAGVTTQLHGEIRATPNDLHWRNIEMQSNGRTGTKATQPSAQAPLPKPNGTSGPPLTDDEYWSSFPPHIKNFVSIIADCRVLFPDEGFQGTNHVQYCPADGAVRYLPQKRYCDGDSDDGHEGYSGISPRCIPTASF